MVYKILAVLVLFAFYCIYFGKMILQKRQGIRTHQIGVRKEKKLHTVEVFMSIATSWIVVVQLFSIVRNWSYLPESARFTGFLLGMAGDAIFLMAVVTMKDSWRAGIPDKDQTKFVRTGIYAFSRNPAFLGFDFMYIGVCLLFCNWLMIISALFAIVMLHMQILQEENYLSNVFGEEYTVYKKQVGRYLGKKNDD